VVQYGFLLHFDTDNCLLKKFHYRFGLRTVGTKKKTWYHGQYGGGGLDSQLSKGTGVFVEPSFSLLLF
jgi:hypothetical protein